MAKIKVIGNAVAIQSNAKLEDLKVLKKYRPQALTLFEGEGDKKEAVFAVGTSTEPCGKVSAIGVMFGSADAEGFAVATVIEPCMGEEPKVFVAEKYGPIAAKLTKLEATIPAAIAEVEAEKAGFLASVEVL